MIRRLVLAVGIAAAMAGCSRDRDVTLQVDFTSRPQWRYAASVSINGEVRVGTQQTSYQGSLQSILIGDRVDTVSSRMQVRLDSVELSANFLDTDAVADLRHQIAETQASLSLDNGEFILANATTPPQSLDWQWNVFRSMAKVVPSLPHGPVSIGTVWERERTIPLQTRNGEAVGHVYQNFVLDSIVSTAGRRTAAVTWTYTYMVELVKPDTAGVLHDLPGSGKGRGSAVVDIDAHILRSAEVQFDVLAPADTTAPSVAWREVVRLELND